MGKSFSTTLLAVGAIVLVGIFALVLGTDVLGGGDDEESSTTLAGTEQHIYLTNLGMT